MKIIEGLNVEAFELIVSEDCNYRCKYCFDNFYANSGLPCPSDARMKKDMIPDLINFMKHSNKSGRIDVTYFGGEPLLNWNFIKEFTPAVKGIWGSAAFGIVTNGSLLTPEISDFLLSHNMNIIISLDGKSDSHDLWRYDENGEGTWERSVMPAMYMLAKDKRRNIGINMVLNSDTVHNLCDNYEFFVDIGFKNITMLINVDNPWSKEQLDSFRDQLNLIMDKKLPLTRDMVSSSERCNSKNQQPRYCFSPIINTTISATGELFFCHRFVPKMRDKSTFEHSYGNIYDGYTNRKYFNEMVERTNFDEIQEKIGCSSCSIKYRCAGGCIAAHYFSTNNILQKNKNFCKIWNTFYNTVRKRLR